MPTNELGALFETLKYQTYFNTEPDAAAAELTADMRRTARTVLRTVTSQPPASFLKDNTSFLRAWDHIEEVLRQDFSL